MKGVLDRLLADETNYHGLCPDGCKQSHREAVWIYRAGERISRAGAKAKKRARRHAAKSFRPSGRAQLTGLDFLYQAI